MLEHPHGWKNDYLVYLYGNVNEWIEKLERSGTDFSIFKEPDLDNRITAIALESDGRVFRKLELIR